MSSIQGTPGGPDSTIESLQAAGASTSQEVHQEQVAADEGMQKGLEELVNPMAAKQEKAAKTLPKETIKALLKKEKPQQLGPIEKIAKEFSEGRKNPELKPRTLALLRQQIKPDDTK